LKPSGDPNRPSFEEPAPPASGATHEAASDGDGVDFGHLLELAELHGWPVIGYEGDRLIQGGQASWLTFTAGASPDALRHARVALCDMNGEPSARSSVVGNDGTGLSS
jgi:hypothetical protein